MILPIYVYGCSVLRDSVQSVGADYPELERLVSDMFETMHSADGVGIAAPQVGRSLNLFCVDLTPYAEDYAPGTQLRYVFMNAEMIAQSAECDVQQEGCLSVPGVNEHVSRPLGIKIRFQDEQMVWHEREFSGFLARVIQHEYDHIQGVVFTDRLSPLRKNLVKSRLASMARGKFSAAYRCRSAK